MSVNLKQLRSRLEDEQKHLLAELEELRAGSAQTEARREGSPFGKREEEATESFELEKRLALERQLKAHFAEVEHALDKFQKGTYGFCDVCGQPISPDRLEALPQANLCMSCKAKQGKETKGR